MEDYSTGTNLIENNIFQHVTAPLSHNGANTGSVFGYNFAIDDNYTGGGGSPGWMIPGVLYHEVGIVPWPAIGPDVTTGTETGGMRTGSLRGFALTTPRTPAAFSTSTPPPATEPTRAQR